MEENKKRRMIKMFFAVQNVIYPVSIAGVGMLLMLFGMYKTGGLVTLSGVVLFVAFFGAGGANESQIDTWFREDVSQLRDRAMGRLGLEESDLEGDPVVIVGPILWKRPGIPDDELLFKKCRDKLARFSVYHVTIIFLTEHYLNAYSCDFNFLRNVALNEHDSQYHYRSIVSVAMGELSQSFTLKTGEKLVSVQGFTLSFTNDEKISVAVSSQKLKDLTNAELPTTDVEKSVNTIRAMVQSKIV